MKYRIKKTTKPAGELFPVTYRAQMFNEETQQWEDMNNGFSLSHAEQTINDHKNQQIAKVEYYER